MLETIDFDINCQLSRYRYNVTADSRFFLAGNDINQDGESFENDD